ncbi:tryptophan transporter [Anaeromicrobium sediminis]|uniref:Tryptophan transporter n=1 Tax=Anaeromicrobium sediminis TaxID=1478221 RepID=A0A267MER9_9FIRM|nr:tryptophan transporter [Anaeromicrobium sediminis]PAB58074.1 tryptophan transporter [Anaeromicrobium sediminis]
MDLRKNILTALLIAIGFILHQVIPGILGAMKFDIMLSVIFVCLLVNTNMKNILMTALLGGFITAMTTTFPGGQIPNIIDKIITCLVIYMIIKGMEKYKKNIIFVGFIGLVGTIISGTVFLYSASLIVGLPASFKVLFLGVVLPTSFFNTIATVIVYNAVKVALKHSRIEMA